MDLLVSAYELSKGFPADERFALTSQFRRATVSVPPNIAQIDQSPEPYAPSGKDTRA